MPRSRALKSIATGLLGSFVSRNNDIGGYWGIGVLCRDTAATGGMVELNLITQVCSPATTSCQAAAASYAQKLQDLLRISGFNPNAVADANVTLQFGAADSRPVPTAFGPGEPFHCTVTLTGSNGKSFSVTDSGGCKPHDPSLEQNRSGGI
jgi:hypothetical protein